MVQKAGRFADVIMSSKFCYNREEKSFTAEASDLKGFRLFQPMYDDAADVGFVMMSAVSGTEIPFFFVDETRTDEGELVSMNFRGEHRGIKYTVKVWND